MATTKTPYFLEINDNVVVELSVIEANMKNIATELGMTKVPADGALPAGKGLGGSSRAVALELGCLPIRVYYKKGGKRQSTVLLCPPSKADTVYKNLIGKNYGANKIVKVGPVRRVRYTVS